MNRPDEKETSDLLKKIFTPTLLALGIIGNILSILIFSKRSLRKYTTFRYLTYLSIFDLCTLVTGYGHTLFHVYFNIDIRLVNEFSCKVHSFLVYFFTQSSSMILIFMSIDRTIVITTKFGSKISTVKTTQKLLIFLIVSVTLINFHFIVFAHLIDIPIYVVQKSDMANYTQIEPSAPNDISYYLNYDYAFVNKTSGPSNFSASSMSSNQAYLVNSTMNNMNNFVIMKTCYGRENSLYFMYLVEFFPW